MLYRHNPGILESFLHPLVKHLVLLDSIYGSKWNCSDPPPVLSILPKQGHIWGNMQLHLSNE